MRLLKVVGIGIVIMAASGWLFAQQREAGQKLSIEILINDLGSGDGAKRTAATKEIFRRGKDVLPDHKKASAKQVAPAGATIDGTRRLDIVYSVLAGLPPTPPRDVVGYRTDKFGLHLEKGMTTEEVQKMSQKYKCTLDGKLHNESKPNCDFLIGKGQSLEEVIRQILVNEPKVITINLSYFERKLVP
jgi:hypothetical protein